MNDRTVEFLTDVSNGFYKEMPLVELANKVLDMERSEDTSPLPKGLYITPDYYGVTSIPYRTVSNNQK